MSTHAAAGKESMRSLERAFQEKQMLPQYMRFTNKQGDQRLTVYATGTQWQKKIIDELPAFIVRGEEIFGAEIPHIKMYLFENRKEFEASYPSLFGTGFPYEHEWHDGTGAMHTVAFCDFNQKGEMVRGPGDVLHEYGHALCNTLYGHEYLVHVPIWWNEGTSDYIADLFYKEKEQTTQEIMRAEQGKGTFPDFDLLLNDFFHYPNASYTIARQMVREIVGAKQPSILCDILNRAKANAGDFNEAIEALSGCTPQLLYERAVSIALR